MAFSPLRSKALHHGRSLSLPTSSNPAISQFDDNLSRLRSSSDATCLSISSLNSRVNGLGKLYCSIDDLLLLPHNQEILSEKSVERILDDYIKLFDACSSAKDLVSLTKQDLRELLSAIRRKDVNGVSAYLISRRNSKKMIQKSLKNLRSFRSSLEEGHEEMTLVCKLKDAESVAFSMMDSLLSYTMGQGRKSGWSMVTKLIHSKKGEETLLNEFDKVDSFLQQSQENEILVDNLKEMESSIEVLEEELESLFRQLIKTRVSLLNIINH